MQQFAAGDVPHAISRRTTATPYRLDQMALAQAALPHENQVVAPADEFAGGQLFHLHAVDELSIELPVERLQGDRLAKLRLLNP